MEDHIYFRDKSDQLKGPYSERQIQEWYRQKWFDSAFPFYFTQSDDEPPTDSKEGWFTLGSLRSRNGIGCPFRKINEKEKSEFEKRREEREKRLGKIQKDIADLREKCTAGLSLEQKMDSVERKMKQLATPSPKETAKTAEETRKATDQLAAAVLPLGMTLITLIEVIAKDPLRNMEDIFKMVQKRADERTGVEYDDLIQKTKLKIAEMAMITASLLRAFGVYASGDFASWKDEDGLQMERMLNLLSICDIEDLDGISFIQVAEHLLIERMKEEDFFFCDLCQTALFNYKQALVHFTSSEHRNKETAAVKKSGITRIHKIIDGLTQLPKILVEEDEKKEQERKRKFGVINMRQAGLRPSGPWVYDLCWKYAHLICTDLVIACDRVTGEARYAQSTSSQLVATKTAVDKVKGPVGKAAFDELHEHLGRALTYCIFCGFNTGDREGFYAHLVSSTHMKEIEKDSTRFDILAMLVNVHRKDLI